MTSHWTLTKRSQPSCPNPPGHPGPREVLTRFQRAAIDKATDDFANLYALDAIHEFPFTRPGVPSRLQGREQIRAFAQPTGTPA
jgi:hypothetical protein